MLSEFRQERKIWKRQQAIAEKQLLPIFRKALRETVKPVIDFVRSVGTDINPTALINGNVWNTAYLQAYQITGMKLAKQEYYRQRGLEQQKASAIDFLVDIWSGALRDYALTYAYKIQRDLNQTTIDIITKALGDANALGLDREGRVRIFERFLDGSMKIRSRVISRTESTTIANIGKDIGARSWIEEQGGQGYKIWLGRNDPRERPTHINENDTIIKIEDKFVLTAQGEGSDPCDRPGDFELKPKNRINCYLPDTRIDSNIIGGQRSLYSGEVCEIVTVGGERLTITPNHDILTPNGFVKAKHLRNGDYLLTNTKKENRVTRLINNYIYKKPSLASDIFRSISILWGSKKMVVGALDFNGDAMGMNNQIDIVNANIELPINSIELLAKSRHNFGFKTSNSQRILIERFCGLNLAKDRSHSSFTSFVRLLILPFSLRFSHFRPFEFLSIGRASNINASRFKSSIEGYTSDAAFIADLFKRDSGQVSIDQVLEVRNFHFSGHVYDFSSLNGVNIANNIYTSNCRCTVSYMTENRYNAYVKRGRIIDGKVVGAS